MVCIFPADEDGLNYPNSSMVVKLKSKYMPHALVESLQKKCEAMVKKLVIEDKKPQLMPIFEFVNKILESNNLIPAWSELPEIKKLLNKDIDEIKLFEKQGKMKFKIKEKEQFLEFELLVPEEYPYA